jgi:hypothetical protein
MYTGSCHCGRIAFEFEGELSEVKECTKLKRVPVDGRSR